MCEFPGDTTQPLQRLPCWSSGLHLPMQGVWIWPLVWKLRSHLPHGQKPEHKQQNQCCIHKLSNDIKTGPHPKKKNLIRREFTIIPIRNLTGKPVKRNCQEGRFFFFKPGESVARSQSDRRCTAGEAMWPVVAKAQELDHKGGWEQDNWCCQTVLLQKTLESHSDCKEIQPVHPQGNQSWIFIGRTDAEAPILWLPDVKSWLTGKGPDAGKDWGQEEKGVTEDEVVGWHHQLRGHEFQETLGDSEGLGSLACCRAWGRKKLDMT